MWNNLQIRVEYCGALWYKIDVKAEYLKIDGEFQEQI